ncbi:hypothetical protein B0O99DRAFT_619063 [Bisporella sp. PMI_857]|nr:hypothetical protein B0O99DRAFT_619063 [Bisporella sp. PMI_857]
MSTCSKPRRTHHKSRKGCTECKRRHVKCDEGKPTCCNCRVSSRSCKYVYLVSRHAEQSLTVSSSNDDGDNNPRPLKHEPGRHYTIEHFTLFNHVATSLNDWLGMTESMRPLSQLYVQTALKTSYVMHQLLAIAALHLGHQDILKSEIYWRMAMDLRNEGLALFTSINEQDAVSQFMFSSLVSVHILAEELVVRKGNDLDTFIDSFANNVSICQGARIVGQRSWDKIHDSELKSWFLQIQEDQSYDKLYLSRSQESFTAMLQSSTLDQVAMQACEAASQTLDFVRRRLHSPRSWGPHAPMAWVVLVCEDYVQLLKSRTPEAMVLLAHFAELLYQCRDFWIFGDAGARLIQAIANELGPAWASWLEIPSEALRNKRV